MVKKFKNVSIISTGSWVPQDISQRDNYQTYRVNIDDLVIKASIGIHEHEKRNKQRISMSASIEVADNIANVDQ